MPVHKIGPRLVEEHKKEIKIIQIESLVAQILVFVRRALRPIAILLLQKVPSEGS